MTSNGAGADGAGNTERCEMPPNATKCREMPRNGTTAAVEVDEEALSVLLEAVGDAYLLPEAEARELLALATARGIEPVVVVAGALLTRWKVEREGGLKRPAMYLRRLLERGHPERQVTEQALREARAMLGVGEEEAREEVAVEIVGQPPYDPAQVWEKALERLRDGLGRVDFNTWLRDSRLVRWEDGLFVIGVPNVLAKDWLRNRLDGRVREALQAVTGNEDVGVMYAVVPRISKAAMAKTANRRYTSGSYGH